MHLMPYHNHPIPTTEEADKALDQTKGRLFFGSDAAFLGSLCCNHKFIWDLSIPTANCNGTVIRINPQFFMWLEPEERLTLVVHELWHTGLGHMIRFWELLQYHGKAYPELFNQAADHVINLMMQAAGFVFGPKLMSIGPCIDPQYTDMFTEQVYDILVKQLPPPPPPMSGGGQGQPQQGQGQPGQQPSSGQGSNPPPIWGNDLAPPEPADDGTATSVGEAIEEITSKIVSAHQAAQRCKEAGNLPGELEATIEALLYKPLPWDVLLSNWFSELSRDEYSYARPSRRSEDEYLPSRMGNNGLEHLVYFIDVSGSVTDAVVSRFNSEVKYIHSTYQPQRLTVITFDTKLQDFYDWGPDDDFNDLVIHGRGGTDLRQVHDYLVKNQPSGAIIFTDLYVQMMPNPHVPVIWVVNDNPKATVPFGKLIHIKTE